MSDFESYKVTNIGKFYLYSAVNCTNNFNFDNFFENYEEEQLVEFFITPKQVVIVYMGDVPNAYHIEISIKLARWINKNDMSNIIALELDGSTGRGKIVSPVLRYGKTVTSDMMEAAEAIYNKIKSYNIKELFIDSIEELYNMVTIDDNMDVKEELIVGIPIRKFINDINSVYKR